MASWFSRKASSVCLGSFSSSGRIQGEASFEMGAGVLEFEALDFVVFKVSVFVVIGESCVMSGRREERKEARQKKK